jgi:Ca2+-binding EF-hand superfamily protein
MDYDHSGLIEYDEFLRNIRGPMNANRRKIVDQAFQIMDKDGNGYLDYNDIKDTYNAKFHPDVKSGKKTEQQVLQEFLETFETAHNLRNNTAPDHVVTKEEWEEYYNNVSASIDRDDYFATMMNSAWNLDGKRVTKKGWSNKDTDSAPKGGFGSNKPRITGAPQGRQVDPKAKDETPPMNYSESQLMDVFRKKLAARGARGIMGIGRQFKIADDDGSKSLNVEEFQKCCHDFRIGITDDQAAKLFKVFDRDGSGSIDYDEFLRGVRGGMNKFRQDLCMLAFDIMDRDKSGVIDINDIRQRFNAKQHPDVKSGKKTEDEILCEFLDTFEAHHADHAGSHKDHRVDKYEFIEYYNNISMSIDRDDYFELMIRNAWHIPGGKGWAANTSIKRVLRTNADGSQEVV